MVGRKQPQIRRDLNKFVSMSLLASLWFQGAGSMQILIKKLRFLFFGSCYRYLGSVWNAITRASYLSGQCQRLLLISFSVESSLVFALVLLKSVSKENLHVLRKQAWEFLGGIFFLEVGVGMIISLRILIKNALFSDVIWTIIRWSGMRSCG